MIVIKLKIRKIIFLVLLFLVSAITFGQQSSQAFHLVTDHKGQSFSVLDGDRVLMSGIQVVLHTVSGDYIAEFGAKKPRKFTQTDNLGKASVVEYSSDHKLLNASIVFRASSYDNIRGLIVETILINRSDKDLKIFSMVPLHVVNSAGGSVNGFYTRVLLNGAMYYDAGRIHNLGSPFERRAPYGEMKGGYFRSGELEDNPETAYSWWNIGLFNSYHDEGLSIGYLGNHYSLGRIKVTLETDSTHSVIVESVYHDGMTVKPGGSLSSDRILISKGSDPYSTLEKYAEILGKANKALTGKVINGWCNWFYTHENFSAEEILRNAQIISEKLLPYGMETVQIDEGYQVTHGDWQGNARFPQGLKTFADSIRSMGLKTGIWIAPFVISEQSWVYRNHPEWLLKTTDGKLKRIGPWPDENTDWFRNESPKRYGLDITHPDAEKWFRSLIDSMANVYGFDMIKIDFVAWTVFSAERFYDPSATPSGVYRKALSIMHRMAGDKCHILDCGPGQVSIGNIHSMRSELDANYGFFPDVWKTYFIGPSSSSDALGKRYYFHNRAWTNDIDHICIDLAPISQAQAITSLIALSGGNIISGDRLLTMDETRMHILLKAFPSTGITARPVNLLEGDPQTVFAVACEKDSLKWIVAGFFNPDTSRAASYTYTVDRLWLDPRKKYLCFDFWKQRYAGEVFGKITVPVDAGGVSLLAVHEKTGFPQVISSSRHIYQGLIEFENVKYDTITKTLSGRYLGPLNSLNSIFIYLPDYYWWDASPGKLFYDYGLYSVKYIEPHILRVDFRFKDTEPIDWSIKFHKTEE